MNDNQIVLKSLCEIQLLVAKRKLKVCNESTKTNRHLHIEMLNAEIVLLTEFINGF